MNNTDILLNKLAALQSKGDKYFSEGIFPSQRLHKHLPYQRPDECIWFSASVAYILQQSMGVLSNEQQQKANKIIEGVAKNYVDFQNVDGLKTYNFFKTKPSKHFPNGYLLSKMHKLKLADDSDDTAMIYLTKPHTQSDAVWLADKLIKHANGKKQYLKHTFEKYKKLKLYSVYFGKNIPPEIDFCILTNILLFKHQYKLPLNDYDQDAFSYLVSVINSNEHIHCPFVVAPYYPTSAQILYHMARLIDITGYEELSAIREKVITEINNSLAKASGMVEKLLLNIAALRLGLKEKALFIKNIEDVINNKKATFFYSSPLVIFDSFFIRKLDKYKIFHITHLHARSEAYLMALVLEYKMLLISLNKKKYANADHNFIPV